MANYGSPFQRRREPYKKESQDYMSFLDINEVYGWEGGEAGGSKPVLNYSRSRKGRQGGVRYAKKGIPERRSSGWGLFGPVRRASCHSEKADGGDAMGNIETGEQTAAGPFHTMIPRNSREIMLEKALGGEKGEGSCMILR